MATLDEARGVGLWQQRFPVCAGAAMQMLSPWQAANPCPLPEPSVVEPQPDLHDLPDYPVIHVAADTWRGPGVVHNGRAIGSMRSARSVPMPETQESPASGRAEGLAAGTFGLALPLWQTAFAGGLACVSHRAVAGSVADLLASYQSLISPVCEHYNA